MPKPWINPNGSISCPINDTECPCIDEEGHCLYSFPLQCSDFYYFWGDYEHYDFDGDYVDDEEESEEEE